jgi:hypothetical protein
MKTLTSLIFILFSLNTYAQTIPSTCGSGTYTRKVTVSTLSQLVNALKYAVAGDYIAVQPGTYIGNFSISGIVGTSTNRVHVCSENGAVIFQAKTTYGGYGLAIKNSRFIRVAGIEITGHLKGVMLDNSSGVILHNLNIHDIGNEGVHFRTNSSNNNIQYSEISYTGKTEDWYGEGVYIGSAESNWCNYTGCQPDASNNNKVLNCNVHHTGAESVDIKEGTSGGRVQGNTFEGSLMTGEYADSFVDVKGNNYLIDSNTGTVGFSATGAYQLDAFQVHVVTTGNGNGNTFSANTVSGALTGYVVWVQSTATGNVVTCDNTALDGAAGITQGACL